MSGLKCPQCGIQLGKGQGLLAGMQGQPGHCLNMVNESFQEKKKNPEKKRLPFRYEIKKKSMKIDSYGSRWYGAGKL